MVLHYPKMNKSGGIAKTDEKIANPPIDKITFFTL